MSASITVILETRIGACFLKASLTSLLFGDPDRPEVTLKNLACAKTEIVVVVVVVVLQHQ